MAHIAERERATLDASAMVLAGTSLTITMPHRSITFLLPSFGIFLPMVCAGVRQAANLLGYSLAAHQLAVAGEQSADSIREAGLHSSGQLHRWHAVQHLPLCIPAAQPGHVLPGPPPPLPSDAAPCTLRCMSFCNAKDGLEPSALTHL